MKTSESFPIIYIFIFEVKIVAKYAIATTTFSMRGLLRCPIRGEIFRDEFSSFRGEFSLTWALRYFQLGALLEGLRQLVSYN